MISLGISLLLLLIHTRRKILSWHLLIELTIVVRAGKDRPRTVSSIPYTGEERSNAV